MRNTPLSNFFPMPNEIFSLGLSAGEIAVYAYLMFCEDRETYTCHPSYKTIGEALHVSPNTVKKYIRQLESKSLITAKQTRVLVISNASLEQLHADSGESNFKQDKGSVKNLS